MSNYQEPLVFLVGAGPGHPGLLTLRAVECLAKADLVIYDRLVSSRLLDFAPSTAERLCVTDLAEHHVERCPHVNDLLLKAAREGKRVVRLKGGDPLIFGRGGEEAEVLRAAGIPYEIVPGVTAAVAAAAFAGIPLTHRLHSSAVALVTGHENPEKPEANLVVRRIATSRIVLVASPNYLAQAGSPRSPHDLLAHSLIGFEPLAWRDTWRVGGETLTVRPRVLSRSGESLRAAAIAGLGIAAVPDWLVADALVGGHVTRVLEGSALPRAGIFAVYPTNRLLTPKVRAYVDHLVRDLKARGLSR